MVCRGLCTTKYRFKDSGKRNAKNMGFYSNGAKRCNSDFCGGVWIITDGIYCPCCNMRISLGKRQKENVFRH